MKYLITKEQFKSMEVKEQKKYIYRYTRWYEVCSELKAIEYSEKIERMFFHDIELSEPIVIEEEYYEQLVNDRNRFSEMLDRIMAKREA